MTSLNVKETLATGTVRWTTNGLLHRDGGMPAIEWADGTMEWHLNGQRHRDDGMPAVVYANGIKFWFVNGLRHRDGGLPAIKGFNGADSWFVNGRLHRDGGLPSIDYANGVKGWYIHGKQVTEEEAQAWYQAVRAVQRFRERVTRLSGRINVVGLAELVKKRAFCQWYYAPDEVGGQVAKRRLLAAIHQENHPKD